MAAAYWTGALSSVWQIDGNWSANPDGTDFATYPNGDNASFSATTSVNNTVIALSPSAFADTIYLLGTQTTAMTFSGENVNATQVIAQSGSGGATFGTAVVSGVTNGSSNPITFSSITPATPGASFTITGSGGITVSGALTLNPSTGYMTVAASGSGIASLGSISAATLNVTVGTASITTAGSTAISVSAGATIRLGSGTQDGAISGNGALAKVVAGTLTLPSSNTYQGGTTLTAGTTVFSSGALGPSGNVTVNGATLQWATGNTTDLSSRLVLQNSGTATLNIGANDVTFASSFGSNSSSAVTKSGTATLTLNAANTYSGGTTVTQGSVKTANTAALGTGAVTLAAGTTLSTSTAQPKLTLGGKLTVNGSTIRIGG
jgi:autotransporter-associated beta strand protein